MAEKTINPRIEEITQAIRDHLRLQELIDKGEIKYERVVKEYYPKVVYWLEARELPVNAQSVQENAKELSDFVNEYTWEQVKMMEANKNVEDASEEIKEGSSFTFKNIILAVTVLVVLMMIIHKF